MVVNAAALPAADRSEQGEDPRPQRRTPSTEGPCVNAAHGFAAATC